MSDSFALARSILIRFADLHTRVFPSGTNTLVSIMTTRMLLSLRKAAAKDHFQNLDADEGNDSTSDLPISTRMIRGMHFPGPLFRAQTSNVTPIVMEVIHVRGERCYPQS